MSTVSLSGLWSLQTGAWRNQAQRDDELAQAQNRAAIAEAKQREEEARTWKERDDAARAASSGNNFNFSGWPSNSQVMSEQSSYREQERAAREAEAQRTRAEARAAAEARLAQQKADAAKAWAGRG